METNKNIVWVNRLAKGMTVIGILIVLGGIVYGVIDYYEYLPKYKSISGWLVCRSYAGIAGACVTGFLVVAIFNLPAYAIGARQKPGWVLTYASKGLFLLAILRVLKTASYMAFSFWHYDRTMGFWFQNYASILWTICEAIILIALGLTLNRVLPVIEESKATSWEQEVEK